MASTFSGTLLATDLKLAIVVARWNDFVTERLLEGALSTIKRHGGEADSVVVVRVPGSFELPVAAQKLAQSGQYDAIICLGAVVQGQTQHHDYINHAVAQGLSQVSLQTGCPVSFGVLTCETMEQAIDRAGGKAGNKGEEATLAAIEMVSLLKQLD